MSENNITSIVPDGLTFENNENVTENNFTELYQCLKSKRTYYENPINFRNREGKYSRTVCFERKLSRAS